jgi:hypothetical protein
MTTLMTATAPIVKTVQFADSPEDVRQIVGDRGLVELALQAVQIFGTDLPLWQNTSEPGLSSRMLLALLTYSYAAGIYSTADLFWSCRRQSGARYLCAQTWPDKHSLRRFRRNWKAMVESCLRWVLQEVEARRMTKLAEQESVQDDFKLLAERRVELAILMDMA